MTLREVLQIEIWGRRTSRKLLTLIGAIVVLAGIWIGIERYWLTPGERKAAREALAQIDSLQDLQPGVGDSFDAGVERAEGAVHQAIRAASTGRDESICDALGGYLVLTEMKRDDARMQRLMEQQHIARKDTDLLWNEKMKMQNVETRRFVRLKLHETLD